MSFWKLFSEEDISSIRQTLSEFEPEITVSHNNNSSLVETLSKYFLHSAKQKEFNNQWRDYFQSLIIPALTLFQQRANNRRANTSEEQQMYGILGQMWSYLGAFRLHLLLPNHSIDPSAKYAVQWMYMQELIQTITQEIDTRKEIEQLFTGKNQREQRHPLSSFLLTLVYSSS